MNTQCLDTADAAVNRWARTWLPLSLRVRRVAADVKKVVNNCDGCVTGSNVMTPG